MCSQHRPENGADSAPIDTLDRGCTYPGCFATWTAGETHEHESVHWQDTTCDYCAKQQWSGPLRQVRIGRSTSWLCDRCYQRQQIRYEEAVA
jgi:hypothetical protein